jgi:hypothetical protein
MIWPDVVNASGFCIEEIFLKELSIVKKTYFCKLVA